MNKGKLSNVLTLFGVAASLTSAVISFAAYKKFRVEKNTRIDNVHLHIGDEEFQFDKSISDSLKNQIQAFFGTPYHKTYYDDGSVAYIIKKITQNYLTDKMPALLNGCVESSLDSETLEKIRQSYKNVLIENASAAKFSTYSYSKLADELLEKVRDDVVNCFSLKEEDKRMMREAYKEALSKFITDKTISYSQELIKKSITNIVYDTMKKDSDFWKAVDIEAGNIRNEIVLQADYKDFCEEMKSKGASRFYYFVKRNTEKPYYVWQIYSVNNETYTRNGTLGKVMREKISTQSFESAYSKRIKDGYDVLTEYSLLRADVEKIILDKSECE